MTWQMLPPTGPEPEEFEEDPDYAYEVRRDEEAA